MTDHDDLARFEAGIRRRRRFMLGFVIVLGGLAVGVFAYASHRVAKTAGNQDVPIRDLSSLPPDERAAVEAELRKSGFEVPATQPDVSCPKGTVAIPASATVPAFCVEDRDLTNAELLACVDAGKCPEPVTDPRCGAVRDAPPDEIAHCADYASSVAYCQAQGRRFLSMEQWERALRLLGEDVWVRCAVTPVASSS